MKEYIINKTPVRTTEGFKINDIKVKLEIPNITDFKEFEIINSEDLDISVSTKNKIIKTNISLDYNKYYEININVLKKIDKEVVLTYYFDKDILVDSININYSENSSCSFIIKYLSSNNSYSYHHLVENVVMNKCSFGNITILNNLNEESVNILDINTKINDDAVLKHNIFDIGGNIKLNRFYGELLGINSKNYLNNIYIGNKDNILDMNYHVKNINKNTLSNIEVQGLLMDNAYKSFKGTIDFVSGCSKSIGCENENCVLTTDTCKSKSLPMLLCGEEDVVGSHGVSSGKVDEEKLFYLMTKGLSKKEALKLIIGANFSKIVNEVNSDFCDELDTLIDKKIQFD